MKCLRSTLFILLTILGGNVAQAKAIPEEVKQRAQSELSGECLDMFLSSDIKKGYPDSYQNLATGILSAFNVVFAVSEKGSQKYCAWAFEPMWHRWDDIEKEAIASCETVSPLNGTPCEVYARNNDIVYVSIHERLRVQWPPQSRQ